MSSFEKPSQNKARVVGHPPNFWLFKDEDGWDLTRAENDNATSAEPRITLRTTTAPVTINPKKSAVIIIDMQNFFLSAAMGRSRGEGHDAEDTLLARAIPAARKANIQIVYMTWGITEHELATLPPTIYRIFGYNIDEPCSSVHGGLQESQGDLGVGDELGDVTLEHGEVVSAGRMLMRDQWNTRLHDPMEHAYQESQSTSMPDVRFHKARLSGFWAGSSGCADYLRERGITTLLFGGVNTDQCVLASIQDACIAGFDTILLKDGSGTTSPEYTKEMVDFNCRKSWGFVSSCEALSEGVEMAASIQRHSM